MQPFFAAVYDGIKLKMKDGLETDDDLDPQPIDKGEVSVPTGEYSVVLVGKRSFSEDRLLDNKFVVKKDGGNQIKFAAPVPRALAGIGNYTGLKIHNLAYGDRTVINVGIPIDKFINYWTPCLVRFDADYKKGELIDENNLMASQGFKMLDEMVVALARLEQKKTPGHALRDYPGYSENKDALKDAFDVWNRLPDFSASDPASLLAQRKQMFADAGKIWASVQKRNLPDLVEMGSGPNERNDMLIEYKYFVEFQNVLESGAWERLVTAALGSNAASLSASDIDTLTKPIGVVTSEQWPGFFIKQPFDVTKIDKDGVPQISTRAAFYSVYHPKAADLYDITMTLEKRDSPSPYVLSGSFDSDTKRAISLYPVELKNQ